MRTRHRLELVTATGAAVGFCAAAVGGLVPAGARPVPAGTVAAAQAAYPAPVMVYPSPGDRYEQRETQISFRGIPAGEIGPLMVIGSRSGVHDGRIEADSDGDGGSFLPNRRFDAGETVTVTTDLNVVGGTNGRFRFAIDHPRHFPTIGRSPARPRPTASGRSIHSPGCYRRLSA